MSGSSVALKTNWMLITNIKNLIKRAPQNSVFSLARGFVEAIEDRSQ
jgi:hypothetical protein